MRVSRAQAEENRQSVIDTACRLFREHGYDGIGLKDLMKEAGLTQGAFYKQFDSKEDLIVQASGRAMETASQRWSAAVEGKPQDPLGAVVAFYLSERHRDQRMDGCPIVALGGDVARRGAEVKAPFEAGMRDYLEMLTQWLGDAAGEDDKARAMVVLSTMIGALVLSRAVNDEDLSGQLLAAARASILSGPTTGNSAASGGALQ